MPSEISLHVVSDGRSALAGGGQEGQASASVLLSTEKGQYLFNAPDPVQRYFVEKKQWKFGKLRGILFTEITSASAGGFTDLAMALADLDLNKHIPSSPQEEAASMRGPQSESPAGRPAHEDPCLLLAGPSPLFAFLLTLNLVFYRPSYHIRLEELQPRSEARDRLHATHLEDPRHDRHGEHCLAPLELEEGVMVRPILLERPERCKEAPGTYLESPEYLSPAFNIAYKLNSTEKVPERDVISYAIHTPEVKGQFDVKAALALGVPKGPLFGRLVAGEAVTASNGSTVTPDMCVGPSQPGPVVLVIRCPSLQHLEAVVQNECLKSYRAAQGQPGEAQVSLVVHMAPKGVTSHAKYTEFFAAFSAPMAAERMGMKSGKEKGHKQGRKGKTAAHTVCARMHVFLDGSTLEGALHTDALPLLTSTEYQLRLHQLVPEMVAQPMEWSVFDRDRARVEGTARRNALAKLYRSAVESLQIGSFEQTYILQPVSKSGLSTAEMDSTAEQERTMAASLCLAVKESPPLRPWKDPKGEDVTPSVFFLGTAASSPTKYRGVSSILVEVPEFGNMLLDCGGGTYEQLHRLLGPSGALEALRQLKCIWITHKHGDHCLGILPLLLHAASARGRAARASSSCSSAPGSLVCGICGHGHDYESSMLVDGIVHALVSSQDLTLPQFTDPSPQLLSPEREDKDKPLLIVGPMWISMWLKQHSRWVEELDYRFVHAQDLTKLEHPLAGFFMTELGFTVVQAVLMEHSYPTFGVVLEHVCGWKLVYSADSRPSPTLAALGKHATLLIHEATFDAPFQQKALADRHSTVEEAIAVGKLMEAEFVVLTHFSNRFESGKFPNIWCPAFLDVQGMQGRLLVATDLLRLPLDRKQLQVVATQVQPRLQALASE